MLCYPARVQLGGLPSPSARRVPRLAGASFACAATLTWAHAAWAQVAVDWQVSGSATVGVTSNVANTPEPEEGDPNAVEPVPDGFGSFSPAVSVTLETPSATQELGWAFGYQFFFFHSEANTFTNTLSYGVRAPVREGVELTFGVFGSQANLATFNLATPAGATPLGANEGGTSLVFTAGAGQGLSAEVAESLTFSEGLGVSYGQTIVDEGEDQKTYTGSFTLGLTKQFERDSFGGSVATAAQMTPEERTDAGLQPLRVEIVHSPGVAWTREWAPDWTTVVGVGVAGGYDAAASDIELYVNPTANAALTYGNERGTATLAYAHTVAPSVLLRQILVTDAVTLQGNVPIGRTGLDVGASGGYQVSREFDNGFGLPNGRAALADAALGFVPGRSYVRLELRYQYSRQFAGEPTDDGEPLAPTLERHAGLFTVTFGYPDSPVAGGAAPFVIVPAPTANPDVLAQQAPRSERGEDQTRRDEEQERREDRDKRGGSGD